jgi:hypothetical protein
MASKLSTLIEETKTLKAKMQADGKAALQEAFTEFFAAHPEAKAIVWTQYTPYFNDGEACTFSVHDFQLMVEDEAMAEDVKKVADYIGDGEGHRGAYQAVDSAVDCDYYAKKVGVSKRLLTPAERTLIDGLDALAKACHQIEDVLEMTFGDHVKVTATRKGFEVNEYSHD